MRHVFIILFSKHKLLSKIAVLLTHILSVKELEVAADDHFNNGIRMSKWGTNYAWKKLREKVTKRANNVTIKFLTPKTSKVDKTDWKRHSRPAVVNAFYSSIENSIQFPAGILQGNFFGSDRPAYMNYGGIGWVRIRTSLHVRTRVTLLVR